MSCGSTWTRPALRFCRGAPADPARVQLSVADEGSGIASVAIEARRRGEEILAHAVCLERTGIASRHCSTMTIFPAGTYEVRGLRRRRRRQRADPDRRRYSGLIQLPVRQGSRGSRSACRRELNGNAVRHSTPAPSVRFGARVPIHGQVTDAFGHGRANVADRSLRARRVPGRRVAPLTTLTTDEDGSFRYTAPEGRGSHDPLPATRDADDASSWLRGNASRACGVDAEAEPAERSVTASLWCSAVVCSAVRSRLRKARHRSGVDLAGWLTFGNARARSKDGKWSYRYTFTGTTRTSRYRFRVVVPLEDAYPYVSGHLPGEGRPRARRPERRRVRHRGIGARSCVRRRRRSSA